MQASIPEDVVDLLRERVVSLEQLDILLLLYAERSRMWSTEELATRMSLSEEQIEPGLASLTESGLVARNGRGLDVVWCYAADVPTSRVVARLVEIHAQQRLEILRMLSDFALQRIRGSAMRALGGDAFASPRKKRA